jgi:hypothetical protein
MLSCSILDNMSKKEYISIKDIITKEKEINQIIYYRDGCEYIFSKEYVSAVNQFTKADWNYGKFINTNNTTIPKIFPSPLFPVTIRLQLLNRGILPFLTYRTKTRRLTLDYNNETGVMLHLNSGESATVSPEFKAELQRVLDCLPKDKPCKPCKDDEPDDPNNPCKDSIDVSAPTPK